MLRSNTNRTYGWDVDLTCRRCGFSGLPRYEGWSTGLETGLGARVQVYAKLACPKCGSRLTAEAAEQLGTLFRDTDIPAQNKKVLTQFILRLFLVPAGLAFVLFFGMQMDWWNWGMGTLWILIISAIAIPVIVLARNRALAGIPGQCTCGNAHYVYMGALEGEHCFRCYSCFRLLKIRE